MHEKHPIQTSNISSRQLLLQKIEQYTELPLMIAALIMIPLSMGQFFWEISEKTAAIFFLSMRSYGRFLLSILLLK